MAFSKCLKIKQGKDHASNALNGTVLHQSDIKTLLHLDDLVRNSLNISGYLT